MKNQERKVHLISSGIGNLAVAAYLIKDGGFDGANIKIYEQNYVHGGCLDARGDGELPWEQDEHSISQEKTSASWTMRVEY